MQGLEEEKHCEKEIWKDIIDYEGLYQVSNLGRVKSLNYHREHFEKVLIPAINIYGYFRVNLCKNGKTKNFSVHRLVAQAFIPNPNNYPQVNHKKEFEKDNNCVENLEWCTQKYNCNYGTAKERTAQHTDYRKRSEKLMIKVYQYDFEGNLIKEWKSASDAGRNGFSLQCIQTCCNHKRSKTHKGYIWSYEKIEKEKIIKMSEFKFRKIIQKTLDNKPIKIWNTIKEITEQLKINKSCICGCCTGKLKTSGGYKWEYKIIKGDAV